MVWFGLHFGCHFYRCWLRLSSASAAAIYAPLILILIVSAILLVLAAFAASRHEALSVATFAHRNEYEEIGQGKIFYKIRTAPSSSPVTSRWPSSCASS